MTGDQEKMTAVSAAITEGDAYEGCVGADQSQSVLSKWMMMIVLMLLVELNWSKGAVADQVMESRLTMRNFPAVRKIEINRFQVCISFVLGPSPKLVTPPLPYIQDTENELSREKSTLKG